MSCDLPSAGVNRFRFYGSAQMDISAFIESTPRLVLGSVYVWQGQVGALPPRYALPRDIFGSMKGVGLLFLWAGKR